MQRDNHDVRPGDDQRLPWHHGGSRLVQLIGVMAVCVGLFLVTRRIIQLINTVEEKQLAPAAARVNAVLDDVKDITSHVKGRTACVDSLSRWMVSLLRRRGSEHASS